jgi:hypothetical protein
MLLGCIDGQGDRKSGVLFLRYKASEIAALRSMISAWMRIGIFEAMDRDEGDRRPWFVVDELDALGETHRRQCSHLHLAEEIVNQRSSLITARLDRPIGRTRPAVVAPIPVRLPR